MTDDTAFYRDNGYLLVPGVFDAAEVEEMREAIARILENVEGTAHDRDHAWRGVDWGMGLMVAGGNPGFWGWRSRFGIRQAELARA